MGFRILLQTKSADWFGLREEESFWGLPLFPQSAFLYPEERGTLNLPFLLIPSFLNPGPRAKAKCLGTITRLRGERVV